MIETINIFNNETTHFIANIGNKQLPQESLKDDSGKPIHAIFVPKAEKYIILLWFINNCQSGLANNFGNSIS